SLPGILKLAPELLRIHTMLRRLPLADEDHRNIPTVALLEDGIIIYVDFSEGGAELPQERRDDSLGFLAEVAPRTGVQSYVAGAASSETDVFGKSAHRWGCEVASYRGTRTVGKNGRIMTRQSVRST